MNNFSLDIGIPEDTLRKLEKAFRESEEWDHWRASSIRNVPFEVAKNYIDRKRWKGNYETYLSDKP